MEFLAVKTAVIIGGGRAVLSIWRRIFLSYGKLSNYTPLSFESGVLYVKNFLKHTNMSIEFFLHMR